MTTAATVPYPNQAPEPVPAEARRPLWRRALAPYADGQVWTTPIDLLLNLPFGIAWFTFYVVGFSVGFGTIVTFLGIPVLVGVLSFAQVVGAVERGRAQLLLGARITSPFEPAPEGLNLVRRVVHTFTTPANWKAAAYGLVMLPFGIASFTATVVTWSMTAALVSWPVWGWIPPRSHDDHTLWYRGSLSPLDYLVVTAISLLVGGLFLLATPWVMRGLGAAHRGMIRGLLGRGEEEALRERVTQLSESREASVDAAESERRRIERDLHDGAQQRLVALAMDLGLAKERLAQGGDPRSAELVGNAHDEAKRAITELRDLVRGIHPAVLTDRGLDAALSAVAARSPVPVDLRVQLPARPPPAMEAVAYFVVTESLTNIGKHSRADYAWVHVYQWGAALRVEVTDDGGGGAAVVPGGGLAGLADRVKAVEGRLYLSSPAGGPTHLVVELPWTPGVTEALPPS